MGGTQMTSPAEIAELVKAMRYYADLMDDTGNSSAAAKLHRAAAALEEVGRDKGQLYVAEQKLRVISELETVERGMMIPEVGKLAKQIAINYFYEKARAESIRAAIDAAISAEGK